MRLLPLLAAGGNAISLPMSDASADSLVRLVVAGRAGDVASHWSLPIQGDPPLVLWAACKAWQLDRLRPSSIGGLATWLCERALDVLQWPSGQRFDPESPDLPEAKLAARLDADFQAQELAAALSQSAGDGETALLCSLLDGAEAWLELLSGSDAAGADLLPSWLVDHTLTTVAVRREATAILKGESLPPADLDLREIRHRAEIARHRWFAVGSSLIDLLPELTARMARLARLEEEFHAAVEIEKLEAMAEFAAGAGHEINNPLAIIGGRAQLLMAGESDPERRRELAVINAQVKRAHEMIADMRLFARPPLPEMRRFDLVALVDDLATEVAVQAAERRVVVSRSGERGVLEIEADPTQLAVALRALCKNALEWIGHDGRIEIGLSGSDRLVEVRVGDDGPGMTPEQRRHAFDPFYSARQAGRGLGLGLSKCWRIVACHGGRVEAENRPERGAMFTIRLPRRR